MQAEQAAQGAQAEQAIRCGPGTERRRLLRPARCFRQDCSEVRRAGGYDRFGLFQNCGEPHHKRWGVQGGIADSSFQVRKDSFQHAQLQRQILPPIRAEEEGLAQDEGGCDQLRTLHGSQEVPVEGNLLSVEQQQEEVRNVQAVF